MSPQHPRHHPQANLCPGRVVAPSGSVSLWPPPACSSRTRASTTPTCRASPTAYSPPSTCASMRSNLQCRNQSEDSPLASVHSTPTYSYTVCGGCRAFAIASLSDANCPGLTMNVRLLREPDKRRHRGTYESGERRDWDGLSGIKGAGRGSMVVCARSATAGPSGATVL